MGPELLAFGASSFIKMQTIANIPFGWEFTDARGRPCVSAAVYEAASAEAPAWRRDVSGCSRPRWGASVGLLFQRTVASICRQFGLSQLDRGCYGHQRERPGMLLITPRCAGRLSIDCVEVVESWVWLESCSPAGAQRGCWKAPTDSGPRTDGTPGLGWSVPPHLDLSPAAAPLPGPLNSMVAQAGSALSMPAHARHAQRRTNSDGRCCTRN